MADEQLLVKIAADVQDLKKGLNTAKNELGNFGRGVRQLGNEMGLVFGTREVINFFKSTVAAASDAEQVSRKLQAALAAQGDTTAETANQVKAYSAALQAQTTFDDEAITSAQTLLIQLGRLRGDGLEKATKASLDLAAGLGLDLASATLLVAKASAGNASALGRYGVGIKSTGDKAKDFETVLAKIQNRFGGAAAAQVDTYAGSIAQMKNAFNDLQEEVGTRLVPVLSTAAAKWAQWLPQITEFISAMGGAKEPTADVSAEIDALTSVMLAATASTKAYDDHLNLVTPSQLKLAAALMGTGEATIAATIHTQELFVKVRDLKKVYEDTAAGQVKVANSGKAAKEVTEKWTGAFNEHHIAMAAAAAAQHIFGAEAEMTAETMRVGMANTLEVIRELQAAQRDQAASDAFIAQQHAEAAALQEKTDIARQGASALGSAMLDVALSSGTMEERLTRAFESIGETAANMLLQFLINKAIERAVQSATARASIQADAARAGAGAVAATAGIPVVGPAIAPAAGAQAFSTAAAYQALVGFAQGGIVGGHLGQSDPNIIRANRGEEVLRRDDPRHAMNGGGRGGPTINIHVSGDVTRSDADIALTVRRTLKRALEDLNSTGELVFTGAM